MTDRSPLNREWRGEIRGSWAVDGRGGGDPWSDGELVDAGKVRVGDGPDVLFAAVGAVGVDPCDEPPEI